MGGQRWLNVARWVLGLALAALAITLLARGLDWRTLVAALKDADYGWISLGVLAIALTVVTRALRWCVLLSVEGVGFWSAFSAILVGQVVNVGVPVARSGDFARVVWFNRRGHTPGIVHTLGSLVVEKIYDLLALCATGFILLLMIPLPSWFVQSTWGLFLALAVGLIVLYLGLHWQEPLLNLAGRVLARLPERVGRLLMPRLGQLVEALDRTRHPRASVAAAMWTAATWLLGGFTNWIVLKAFGAPSVPAAVFLLATLMLGSSVVPTPGRIGVFEGITVVSLAQFDIEPGPALAIGLVLHLAVIGPPLILAAVVMAAHALGWLSSDMASEAPDPVLQESPNPQS